MAQQTLPAYQDLSPGKVHQQMLTVKEGTTVAELPVRIIKGIEEGPVFTIVAGIHGYEYAPIIAVQQLMSEIKPGKLKGTLVIVPVANMAGFYGRSIFYNPQDGKNLNRVFPGNPEGTISERLAHLITSGIISRSNVFLDIHAGDGNEDLLDFVCYYDNKQTPEQTSLARRLTECAGFKYNVVYPFSLQASQPAEYAFKQATRQGVTALSIEAGKLGGVDSKSVEATKKAVYNMLAEMKMYEPLAGKKDTENKIWLNGQDYIKSPGKGIFYSVLKSGDKIIAGQKLGFITDVFGTKLAEITGSQAGIILYKIDTPPVLEGETLFCIGYSK
jgi:predicted deacylase